MNINMTKDNKYKFTKKDGFYGIDHQLSNKISRFTKLMSVYEVKEVYDVTLFEKNRTFLIYYKDRNDNYKLIEGKLLIKEEVKPLYKFISTEPLQILEKGIYFGKNTGIDNHLEGIYKLIIKNPKEKDINTYILNTFAKQKEIKIENIELNWKSPDMLDMSILVKDNKDILHVYLDYDKKSINLHKDFFLSEKDGLQKFNEEFLDEDSPLNFLDAIIQSDYYNSIIDSEEKPKVYSKR